MWVATVLWAGILCAAALQAGEGRVAQRPVKVRSGPAVHHAIVERLEAGASLTVLKDGDRWVEVRSPSGTQGWVSARVFSQRPAPKGYSAVLEQQGLAGVSTAVSTMATRGLNALPGPSGGLDPLVIDFLDRVPFDPAEFDAFARGLNANPICERLPGWLTRLGRPLPGDPQRDEQERQLGLRLASLVLRDAELVTDPKLDAYVNQVGAAVAAASSRYDLEWRFVIFEQPKVESFAAPGGLVFLSSGLLQRLTDEAELAGVLAHQIAHVALGHGAAELAQQLEQPAGAAALDMDQRQARLVEVANRVMRTARSAQAEREADAYGATYAACAGYDPAGLARVYRRLQSIETAGADSPPTAERCALIDRVRQAAGQDPGQSFPARFRIRALAKAP